MSKTVAALGLDLIGAAFGATATIFCPMAHWIHDGRRIHSIARASVSLVVSFDRSQTIAHSSCHTLFTGGFGQRFGLILPISSKLSMGSKLSHTFRRVLGVLGTTPGDEAVDSWSANCGRRIALDGILRRTRRARLVTGGWSSGRLPSRGGCLSWCGRARGAATHRQSCSG
jgi:hypothetical protein